MVEKKIVRPQGQMTRQGSPHEIIRPVLEIKEDNRRNILRTLKEREKKNRKILDPNVKIKSLLLDINLYDVLQLITAKAKNYSIHTKRQLEKLAGNII